MRILQRPDVKYPTLIRGYIDGPIRCESADGTEMWLPPQTGKLYIPPFLVEGKPFGVSHIQRRAKYFNLLYDPYIYHWGRFWRLQEEDETGKGKPGTEQGIYWRTPGWRWQVPDENSEGTNWIWSWGRAPGAHLD